MNKEIRMVRSYLINGFLEAGKTSFISRLFEEPAFNTGETTLVIQCEEGIEEYEEDFWKIRDIHFAKIEKEEDFNPEYITKLEKAIKPKRVIVEFNGMWIRKDKNFPWYWDDPIEIALIDARSFENYSKNMRSLVAEHVRTASMVVFNRADGIKDKLANFKRNIKAVNREINVVFEDDKGIIKDDMDYELPYDISEDYLKINEECYIPFYLDIMENVDKYLGKEVEFTAMVIKAKEDEKMMVIGRLAMTCCMDDLSTFAFITDFDDAPGLKVSDWIRIRAKVEKDYAPKFDLHFPVFHVEEFNKVEAPEYPIIENV